MTLVLLSMANIFKQPLQIFTTLYNYFNFTLKHKVQTSKGIAQTVIQNSPTKNSSKNIVQTVSSTTS